MITYFRLNPPELGKHDLSDIEPQTIALYQKMTLEYLNMPEVDAQVSEIARRLNS